MIELPEESQEWDERVFELLMKAIPPARSANTWTATTITAEEIRRVVEDYRIPERPTWVVPPGLHVDPTIPVNVVESPLVGPGHFIHIPVDAFDPHPWLD